MDRRTLKALHKAYKGKPVTADRLNDLFVYYCEEAHQSLLTLEEEDRVLIKNPRRIQDHGTRSCRDAETILSVMYIFGLIVEDKYVEEIRKLNRFTAGLIAAVP